jgi:transposase InsO family protein
MNAPVVYIICLKGKRHYETFWKECATNVLCHKSKTLAKSKQLVENQTNNEIKVLRVNNGGEHKSNEFTKFYQKTNIQIQFIIFDTPQQNGAVERWN